MKTKPAKLPVIVTHTMADGTVLTDEELGDYQLDPEKVPYVVLKIIADMLQEKR